MNRRQRANPRSVFQTGCLSITKKLPEFTQEKPKNNQIFFCWLYFGILLETQTPRNWKGSRQGAKISSRPSRNLRYPSYRRQAR